MRVWALASCGGLLALAACNADQANTPHPNSPPPDADGLSQGKASPPTASLSPLARPETPARQVLSARPRLNPAAVSARASRPAAQPQPQSEQLRARLQRLRDQQGARLAPSAAAAAAPIPTAATVFASPAPLPGAPTPLTTAATPGAITSNYPIAPLPNRAEPSPLVATPTPLSAPQPTVTTVDVASSGTAANWRPVVAASTASNYPIAPQRHQGHSVRSSTRSASPQVLVSPPTSQPIAARARLHGSEALALATQPTANTAESVSETAATAVPDLTQDSTALLASVPRAVIAREHAASQSRVSNPVTLARRGDLFGAAAGGAHGQEASVSPGSAARLPRQARLTPRPAAPETTEQSFGAIAQPDSLPLNRTAPRLSSQRPAAAPPAVPPVDISSLVSTDRATPESTPEIAPESTTESTTGLLAVPGGEHLSQTDLAPFRLAPSADQSPKGLPLAHCLPTSAHAPLDDRLVNDAIAAQPSFSGRNQSTTPGKPTPTALCWGNTTTQDVALEPMPAAAPVPDKIDFPAAEAANLDLETLAPVPSSD